MLKRRTANILGAKESKDSSDEQEDFGEQYLESSAVTKPQAFKKEIGVKDKVQFKRKKAKVAIYILLLCFSYIIFIPLHLSKVIC